MNKSMKKHVLAAGLTACLLIGGAGAYAQQKVPQEEVGAETRESDTRGPSRFSIGGGGYLVKTLGGGWTEEYTSQDMSYEKTSTTTEVSTYFGAGAFVFFDVKYVELSLGYFRGTMDNKYTWESTTKYTDPDMEGGEYQNDSDFEYQYSFTELNISALGKYPYALNQKTTIFPLLGVDCRYFLSRSDREIDSPFEYRINLWVKFGGGIDYALTSNLFVRFEALYGIRLATKGEDEAKDFYRDYEDTSYETLLTHGLTAKLAIGYSF